MTDMPLTDRQIRARDIIQVTQLRPDMQALLRQTSDPETDTYQRNGLAQQVAEVCVRAMAGKAPG